MVLCNSCITSEELINIEEVNDIIKIEKLRNKQKNVEKMKLLIYNLNIVI